MKMHEIRAMAKSHKIAQAGLPKIDIILALQREEGDFDGYVLPMNCLWREDFFEASKG